MIVVTECRDSKEKYPERIAFVQDCLTHLIPIYFLHGWSVFVTMHDHKCKGDSESGDITHASTNVEEPYRTLKIELYATFWDYPVSDTKKWQKDVLTHELAHTVTHRLTEQVESLQNGELVTAKERDDANEYVTSWVEQIVNSLMKEK